MGRPPHLMIGGLRKLAAAPHAESTPRSAVCRCGAARRCGSTVAKYLHVPADDTAQVLPPPVKPGWRSAPRPEPHADSRSRPGGPVSRPRCTRPVGVAGERDEHGRPEPGPRTPRPHGGTYAPLLVGRFGASCLRLVGPVGAGAGAGSSGVGELAPDPEFAEVPASVSAIRVPQLGTASPGPGSRRPPSDTVLTRSGPVCKMGFAAHRSASRSRNRVSAVRCQPSRHWAIRSARAFARGARPAGRIPQWTRTVRRRSGHRSSPVRTLPS